ncbi:MAG TPA: phosphoribosylformylglycinamidine synthase I [Ilumatobacteraceae bacterium]|nr:phosphoribosylformylglycinamidine synthase I [Ilumatobacteraceae bacterium]
MSRPTALVLAAAGTNRDHDVAFALDLAGAEARITLLSELIRRPSLLDSGQMVVIAGGFSYADALGAGRMFALQLEHRVGDVLRDFVAAQKPVIGICNGFQVLTRTGLLPGALGHNASGHFQCQWVKLTAPSSRCIWTTGIATIDCPIAHGEGRYTHPDPASLAAAGQVALRYSGTNPNGSVDDIAGVCDASGVVLGLMPHPENHVIARQYPGFTHGVLGSLGLTLFEQGVRYAKER